MKRGLRFVKRKSHAALLGASLTAATVTHATTAGAFCGFYVGGAGSDLYNEATVVVLMRDGTRTVLNMQNDYRGPPKDFALVVPVPVVLQEEQVKTLPREIFARIDKLAAPRLVEYWEQDPCAVNEAAEFGMIGLLNSGAGSGAGFGSGQGRLGVKVEAEFEVGEYDIVILSAEDSGGLETWLKEKKYNIPDGAAKHLKPYVEQGTKFFVAKVDAKKVTFENGRAVLSPLRVHYDSKEFSLPVRLGLINSKGSQDLIVNILARNKRYETASYPNVFIPTNIEVKGETRDKFGAFYGALFDDVVKKNPGAVVTEYSWAAKSCDPCPEQPLDTQELLTLGADVAPSLAGTTPTAAAPSRTSVVRNEGVTVRGALPTEVVQRITRQSFGRYRLCYEAALRANPKYEPKGQIRFVIDAKGTVKSAKATLTPPDAPLESCLVRAVQRMSFPQPEGGGSVTATTKLSFSKSSRGTPATSPWTGGRISWGGFGNDFVLTRLHFRYDDQSLGKDLVFREADPVLGGREIRKGTGVEQGATVSKSAANNFQARYIIRHAWRGKVECESPRRGIWGGPPADLKREAGPRAAADLAFGARTGGKVALASFLEGALPGATPSGGDPARAAQTPTPTNDTATPTQPRNDTGCGACATPGAATGSAAAWLAALVFAGATLRRHQRRRNTRGSKT